MLTFFLPGEPPHSTSQMKGVSVRRGRPHFFKRAGLAEIEAGLKADIMPHRPGEALRGPLRVGLVFVFAWRANDSKRARASGIQPHTVKPDADNAGKLVLDVMTRCGFWGDDAQVYDLHLLKMRGDNPGIAVTVDIFEPLRAPDAPFPCQDTTTPSGRVPGAAHGVSGTDGGIEVEGCVYVA